MASKSRPPTANGQGTTGETETRLGTILIDVSANESVEVDRTFLERLGHPVQVCHGPAHAELCPLLSGTGCSLLDGSHGIIFELDLDRPQHRAILRRYTEVVADDVPISVVVKPGQDTQYADLLSAVQVWTKPPTAGMLDGFAAEVEASDRIAD
jgi:hypothetical protein